LTTDAPVAATPDYAYRPSWFERWSPLGGLLFVIGAVVLAFTPAADEIGETAEEVVSFSRDNDEWMAVAVVFALLSLPLLGWFATGLYGRLRRAGAVTEAVVALVGGVLCAAFFFLAITIWSGPLIDLEDDEATAVAQAATYLAIDDIGWVTLAAAGISAGLMAIAASLAALRLRAVPAWAGWLGVALGVVSFATIAFFGLFAWLAWILIVSVGLLVRGDRRLA
jgi:hypothetical protein